jgi:hypothetical protein
VKSLAISLRERRNICPTWRLFKEDNESEAQGSPTNGSWPYK